MVVGRGQDLEDGYKIPIIAEMKVPQKGRSSV